MAGLAVGGLALSGAAVVVALSGAGDEPRTVAAIVHALVIAAPIAAGLYALHAQPASAGRFGRLMVLSGFLWSPTMLAESANSLLYSMGRVSAWLAEVLLVYVVLAYPSGRLVARADRLLVRAAALIVGVLFLPTALFVAQYPVPTPWASCGSDCPSNAFQVTGSEPGFFDAFIGPLQQATTALIYAGVAVALAVRLSRGSRLTREALLPVLGTAILRMAFAAAFIVARRRSPDSQLTEALGLVALALHPGLLGRLRDRAPTRQADRRAGPDEARGSLREPAAWPGRARCNRRRGGRSLPRGGLLELGGFRRVDRRRRRAREPPVVGSRPRRSPRSGAEAGGWRSSCTTGR